MNLVPHILFVVSGLLTAVAQRRYYDELAGRYPGVHSDTAVAQDIRDRPSRLVHIVAAETFHRLRALVKRQPAQRAERLRIIACVSVAVTLGCFGWTIYAIVARA